MSLSYRQIYPRSQRSSYKPSDIIDFNLTFPSEFLVLNRLRISGSLTVSGIKQKVIGGVEVYEDVFYDKYAGIHSFTNNWMISTQKLGVLENRSNYPRIVSMQKSSSVSMGDMVNSLKHSLELTTSSDFNTTNILVNNGTLTQNFFVNNAIPFSFMPSICLNKGSTVAGKTAALDYNKTGDVLVSFRLVQVLEALFGGDVDASHNYSISDLRLDYMTSLPDPSLADPRMEVITEVKQLVNSTAAQININLPIVSGSMSASFMRTDHELSYENNNCAMEYPNKIDRVYFQFNDQTNAYVFPLLTQEDMIENYLDSFYLQTLTKKNDFTVDKLQQNQIFGLGLAFADYSLNLANSNFGVQIQASGITSSEPYYIYMFFRSVI